MTHPTTLPPEVWQAVAERDGWLCQAPRLDFAAGSCRGAFYGQAPQPGTLEYRRILTFDHVKDAAGGPRIHDEQHGVLLCHWHNTGGWASAHRAEERAYLATFYPEVWTNDYSQDQAGGAGAGERASGGDRL
jgi:uncharacterized protein YodC (DUF2158 family)